MPMDRFTTTIERYDDNWLQINERINAWIKVVVKLISKTILTLQTKERIQLQNKQSTPGCTHRWEAL